MVGHLPLLKKRKRKRKKWLEEMNKKGATSEATPKKDIIIIGSVKGIDIIICLKKKITKPC